MPQIRWFIIHNFIIISYFKNGPVPENFGLGTLAGNLGTCSWEPWPVPGNLFLETSSCKPFLGLRTCSCLTNPLFWKPFLAWNLFLKTPAGQPENYFFATCSWKPLRKSEPLLAILFNLFLETLLGNPFLGTLALERVAGKEPFPGNMFLGACCWELVAWEPVPGKLLWELWSCEFWVIRPTPKHSETFTVAEVSELTLLGKNG